MDNYQYVVNWVQRHNAARPGLRVLDYGCGQGKTVHMLRERGVDCYGCDAFVEIGKAPRDYVAYPQWFGSILKDMPAGRIPFAAEFFDVVVSNQVIEHVENIELTLGEMYRVLRPGGMVFSVFPHKSTWREGHCGVAFLHWFPKHSRLRLYYATACRALGFGYHKEKLGSVANWARNRCQYIDEQTFYRTLPEIHRQFGKYFSNVRHCEASYLRERLGARARLLRAVPDPLLIAAVRAGAGCVFSCEKAAARA
jgi:ubiquinone/menaquinone biosynthesis C-methylase UbiE